MQTEILEALKNHPAVQQMLAEQEAGRLAARADLIARLIDSKAETAAKLAPLDRSLEAMKTRIADTKDQLRDMTREHDTVALQASRTRTLAEREQRALTQQILAGANPRIWQFINWASRAKNLAGFASHRAEPLATNALRTDFLKPSATAARRVSELVAHALAEANEMQMQALSDDDVHLVLSGMAAEIYAAFQTVRGYAPHTLPADYQASLI